MSDNSQDKKRWQKFSRLQIDRGVIKRRARKLENATLKHAHKFLTRRWTNVRDVGRNTVMWLMLVGLLIGLTSLQILWFQKGYTTEGPQTGGLYAEGVIGQLETINPLYTASLPEKSVEKLIFSSLLSYDKENKLRTEVADKWSVSEDGKTYTVKIRDDVYWHDGERLTVDDVLFTISLMQNEQIKSSLYNSWAGVQAKKVSADEVDFMIPSVYAPFAHALTFSILPKHTLKDVEPSDMRENNFGRNPVGSGPFVFKRIQIIDPDKDRLVVHMEQNERYFRSKPKVNRFQLHTYMSSEAMRRGFLTGEVGAVYGLDSVDANEVHKANPQANLVDVKLKNGVFAMLNNDSPVLSDVKVRRSLVEATNRQLIIDESLHSQAGKLDGPLLISQIGVTDQKQTPYDKVKAAALLDEAGWRLDGSQRKKDGQILELNVISLESGDYPAVVEQLKEQWQELGIKVSTKLVKSEELFANYLQPRAYDVLIHELAIGSDPDVYAYWHSSQARSNGLNLANYRSGVADGILSSARSRLEPELRLSKYIDFYEQWLKDVPAIALYQPEANYITTDVTTKSIENHTEIADAMTRYRSVEQWSVLSGTMMETP